MSGRRSEVKENGSEKNMQHFDRDWLPVVLLRMCGCGVRLCVFGQTDGVEEY